MSGSSHGIVVPPGQHPPFATITPTDHAAWIIIAAALGLSLVLVFGGIRIFIRQTVGTGYGADDYLLGFASVRVLLKYPLTLNELTSPCGKLFMVPQSIIVLVACSQGLGKSKTLLGQKELQSIQQVRSQQCPLTN